MSIASRRSGLLAALVLAVFPVAAPAQSEKGTKMATVRALGGQSVEVKESWRRRPASLGLENAYRDILRDWARGSSLAPAEYARFQALVTENIGGSLIRRKNYDYEEVQRGLRCLEDIELNTAKWVGALHPDLTLAISAFHSLVYEHLVAELDLHWLADLNWGRLEALRKSYRDRRQAPPAAEEPLLAALEVSIGGRLERLGLIQDVERARESFGRAARFDPDNAVARYWMAFLDEKFGRYKRSLPSFEWLIERDPADPEVALRLALVRARTGAEGAARDALRALVAGAADGAANGPVDGPADEETPEWIRAVASQELARLLAPSDRVAAEGVLRRARNASRSDPALTIQLAELLGDRSAESLELLEDLTVRNLGPIDAPRRRYEEARTEGLDNEMAAFESWLEGKLPALGEAIDEVERLELIQGALRRHGSASPYGFRSGLENPDRERPVFKNCSGFKLRDKN